MRIFEKILYTILRIQATLSFNGVFGLLGLERPGSGRGIQTD